jgi:hypothetical protein
MGVNRGGGLERDRVRLGVGGWIVTKMVTIPDHWFACRCRVGTKALEGELELGYGNDRGEGIIGGEDGMLKKQDMWGKATTDRFTGLHIGTVVFLQTFMCTDACQGCSLSSSIRNSVMKCEHKQWAFGEQYMMLPDTPSTSNAKINWC